MKFKCQIFVVETIACDANYAVIYALKNALRLKKDEL